MKRNKLKINVDFQAKSDAEFDSPTRYRTGLLARFFILAQSLFRSKTPPSCDALRTNFVLDCEQKTHYFPLLYALALQKEGDSVHLFNDEAVGGSLTMTSVKIFA